MLVKLGSSSPIFGAKIKHIVDETTTLSYSIRPLPHRVLSTFGVLFFEVTTPPLKTNMDTWMSMEVSNYLVRLVSLVMTYLGDLQPTYIGVII